jgi:hypothetical protein
VFNLTHFTSVQIKDIEIGNCRLIKTGKNITNIVVPNVLFNLK